VTARRRGFTVIEIMITMALLMLLMTSVYQILSDTNRGREAIRDGLEGPKIEIAILDEIVRDLRFVYFRPGQFTSDGGFWGRNRTPNGKDGDRIDFLTCRRSRRAELEDTNQAQVNAPLVEVGYACRPNEKYPDLLELWRREDYFADDDPTDGGKYDLVYDRIRKFDLEFYAPPNNDERTSDEGLKEWDTKVTKKLPYAIVVKLEYDIRLPTGDRKGLGAPQGSVRRIILLTPSRSIPPEAAGGMAAMDSGMTATMGG